MKNYGLLTLFLYSILREDVRLTHGSNARLPHPQLQYSALLQATIKSIARIHMTAIIVFLRTFILVLCANLQNSFQFSPAIP